MKHLLGLCSIVSVLSLAAPAKAAISFGVTGLAGTGATADVSFGYQALSASAAQLTISITNTTSAAIGGRITAWGFNVPSLAGVTMTSIGGDDHAGGVTALPSPNQSGWWGKYELGEIKTPNGAGDFDYGVMNASASDAFITDGVGAPSAPRINIGQTTTFTLAIVGTGLNSLTDAAFESAFLSELSTGGTAGAFSFAVRFQGLVNDGSDLGTTTVRPPGDPNVIPIPGAAIMALVGMGGVGSFLRLRRRTDAE